MDPGSVLARAALAALEQQQTRDAAWLALTAFERDTSDALALTVLARIILEVNADPLATLGTRRALGLGLPEAYRPRVEALHRVDLWTRGLLDHGAQVMLPLATFDDGEGFEPTPRFDAWFRTELASWGDEGAAARALAHMVAALSDARVVPDEEDPLRDEAPWPASPAFAAWQAALDVRDAPLAPSPRDEASATLTVLSDYWVEQEVLRLAASSAFTLALERAETWARLRPARISPQAILARIYDATGQLEARDQAVEAMLTVGPRDLNELEEARVALGELGLYGPQIRILDEMEALAPGHPVVLANRGAALLELDEPGRAKADLKAALASDPDHGAALATLGLVYMREDLYDEARPLLERAVVVAPEEPQARVYLAACMNNQGDRKGAIRALEAAVALAPDHTQAQLLLRDLRGLDATN